MNTRDMLDEIVNLIFEDVCGTPSDIFSYIDSLVDEGTITREWYLANEVDILSKVDDMMFCCAICGWNVEMSEASLEASNMGETICCDCGDE
jgi:hypothetical protein